MFCKKRARVGDLGRIKIARSSEMLERRSRLNCGARDAGSTCRGWAAQSDPPQASTGRAIFNKGWKTSELATRD
jgi:hypothetical protein